MQKTRLWTMQKQRNVFAVHCLLPNVKCKRHLQNDYLLLLVMKSDNI